MQPHEHPSIEAAGVKRVDYILRGKVHSALSMNPPEAAGEPCAGANSVGMTGGQLGVEYVQVARPSGASPLF
jgi:hypothetical protein